MEGNAVERDAIVGAVGPVHVGEECDAAHEETQQNHATVNLVQPAVLQSQLQERQPTEKNKRKRKGRLEDAGKTLNVMERSPKKFKSFTLQTKKDF